MTPTAPRLGIIGIGNTLMGDDGIGMVLLERLARVHPGIPGVEYIHGGVGGMNVLHDLAGLDIAIIVDSGDFGGRPGEFKIFSPEDVKSVKFLPRQSLHEADLMKILELSKAIGESPGVIRVMVIQPVRIDMREGLSATLRERIEEYENALLREIRRLLRDPCP